MAAAYTSSSLITAVRDYGYLSPGNPTDATILRHLNRAQIDYCAPELVKASSEYFVAPFEFTTTGSQADYPVPSRSILSKIRDVQTQPASSAAWISLPYIEPERLAGFSSGTNAGRPFGWYLRMDKVVLAAIPDGNYAMRFLYYRRPSQIVSTGYSVPTDLTGATLTVGSTTGMTTGLFDVISSNAPFDPILDDIAGTVASGTTLTLTLTTAQAALLEAGILTGCWIVGAGDTPAPNMSPEMITLLVQRAASTVGNAIASPQAALASAECDRTLKRLRDAMQPRESGLGRKVVGQNGLGLGRIWRGGWGGP